MGALAAQLLHEVVEDNIHQPILLFLDRIDGDVAKEDGVVAHPKVVLNFAQNDLLGRPAVLDDALEPGVLDHRDLVGNAPQVGDEGVRCEWHVGSPGSEGTVRLRTTLSAVRASARPATCRGHRAPAARPGLPGR